MSGAYLLYTQYETYHLQTIFELRKIVFTNWEIMYYIAKHVYFLKMLVLNHLKLKCNFLLLHCNV